MDIFHIRLRAAVDIQRDEAAVPLIGGANGNVLHLTRIAVIEAQTDRTAVPAPGIQRQLLKGVHHVDVRAVLEREGYHRFLRTIAERVAVVRESDDRRLHILAEKVNEAIEVGTGLIVYKVLEVLKRIRQRVRNEVSTAREIEDARRRRILRENNGRNPAHFTVLEPDAKVIARILKQFLAHLLYALDVAHDDIVNGTADGGGGIRLTGRVGKIRGFRHVDDNFVLFADIKHIGSFIVLLFL